MSTNQHPAARLEIRLVLVLWDGTRFDQRFATCEEAWSFQRETSKKAANRRKKSDRVETQYSFYCGCTPSEETFGGWLVGGHLSQAEGELEFAKRQEVYTFRRWKASQA